MSYKLQAPDAKEIEATEYNNVHSAVDSMQLDPSAEVKIVVT